MEEGPSRSGANIVAVVDVDDGTTRRKRAARRKRMTPTPFNGLPIIYGAIGYMALAIVVTIAAAPSISGVWPVAARSHGTGLCSRHLVYQALYQPAMMTSQARRS